MDDNKKRGPKGPRLKKADRRVAMSLTCKSRYRKELEKLLKVKIREYELERERV